MVDEGDAGGMEQAYLAYLLDQPARWPNRLAATAGDEERLWLIVLCTWHAARLRQAVDLAACHRALAGLRRLNPALAAQAEAVFAEAHYLLGPRWAPVWLDLALAQAERLGQHHLKARLLGLKASALEAAGELGEGARFRKVARALAQRQGAALYLRLFVDPLEAP